MGTSTNAYLFYGIELGDYIEIPEQADGEELDVSEYVEMKLEGTGLKLGSHCSGDYPVWYAYSHQFYAWRGDSKEISIQEMEATENVTSKNQFEELLKVLGLPPQEPTWRLASYWG